MKKLTVLSVLLVVLCSFSIIIAAPGKEEQLDLIARSRNMWEQKDIYGIWGYTVTDLDGNGRREIISASVQGTGFYTYMLIYEVSEDGTELAEVSQNRAENMSAPDIMVDRVPTYFSEEEAVRYYIFKDYIRNGYAENYENIRAVYLKDGVWNEIPLANKTTLFTDEEHFTVTYSDPDGAPISSEQYESAAEKFFGSYPEGTACFEWQMNDTESFQALSFSDLTGNLRAADSAACP